MLVLALLRGGVPVAYEVAIALEAPLNLVLVRKLGVHGHRELAMGAIASGGIKILNESVIQDLHISGEAIDRVERAENQELNRRETACRGQRPRPEITAQTIILIDDRVATGATIRAVTASLFQQNPARIVVALPLAPSETLEFFPHSCRAGSDRQL